MSSILLKLRITLKKLGLHTIPRQKLFWLCSAITEYQLGPHVIAIGPLTLPTVSKSGNPGLLVDRILLPKAKRSDLSDRVFGVPRKREQLHGTIRKY